MTALPSNASFTGASVKQGQFKTAIENLRGFLAGLLGEDGAILTALQTLGVPGSRVLAKSGAYTVTTADRGALISCTGTWTLSLPAAATAGDGFAIALRNAGTGLITVNGNSSETVNGATTAVIPPGGGGLLVCSGTAWAFAGNAGDTAQMLPDGSAAAPALTFAGDQNTGLYRIGADQLGMATGGTLRLTLSTTALTSTLPALLPDGSAAAPAVSWSGDTNTGFYRVGADQIGMATGGTLRATLSTTAFDLNLPVTGTAAQSSATDATAGRLLKAGASATVLSASPALRMTYGGTANAITLTSGAAISGTIPTGLLLRFRATSANTGGTTIALDGGSAIACRTITGVALPAGYIRTDVDTVAVYDGTNWVLGREPETGSNGNGEYQRLANGWMTCLSTYDFAAVNTSGFGEYHSGTQSISYPVSFAAVPDVKVSADNSLVTGCHALPGLSSVTVRLTTRTSSISSTTKARVKMTGYWY